MISAIVLAAGLSVRMAKQKMLLPWGETTVIGKVISTLQEAGVRKPCIVVGGNQAEVADLLHGVEVQLVFNEQYANGEMLTSMQVGLKAMGNEVEATLVVLGDQPQIEATVVKQMIARYNATRNPIIVPSYQRHRGHPWIIGRAYWEEIQTLQPPKTLRDFLNKHNASIDYVVVNTPSILQDLDTQDDYYQYKP